MNDTNFADDNKDMPILAICYDFDKTLTPKNMQEQGFIQSLGYDGKKIEEFWNDSEKCAKKNEMDSNLSYMWKMKKEAELKGKITKARLREYGQKIKLYDGVEDWFDRVNDYGEEKGVIIEHYIISSGLKEIIAGTKIAHKFKRIYACSYLFDEESDVAIWPTQVINYTNKTQFLFRIEKGKLDVNDADVNMKIPEAELRVPFRNMIYIGDSDTDIPCMKIVNENGGYSIGIYDSKTNDNAETNDKTKVFRMLRDNRIKYYAVADYTADSELEALIKFIIAKTAYNESIEKIHYSCVKETNTYYEKTTKDEQRKDELISNLINSKRFKETHDYIRDLNEYEEFGRNQIDKIYYALTVNYQIGYIINDYDVKEFYDKIMSLDKEEGELKQEVKKIINKEIDYNEYWLKK